MQNIEADHTGLGLVREIPARLTRMTNSIQAGLSENTAFELEFGGERVRVGNGNRSIPDRSAQQAWHQRPELAR
jgi:hypothetical protein